MYNKFSFKFCCTCNSIQMRCAIPTSTRSRSPQASIHIKRDAIVRRIEGLEKFLDELRTQKAEMDAQIAHLATAAHTRPRPRQVSIRSRPQPLTIVEESEESEESAVAPPVDLPTPPSRIRTCDPDETGGAQSPSDDLDDLMVRSLSPLVLALGTSTPPGPAAVLHIEPAAAAAKPLSPRRSLQTVHLTATAAAAAGPIFQMRSLERSRSVRTVVVHAKARAGASAEGPSGTSPKRRGTAPSASSPSPTLALGLTLRQDGVDRESNVRVETRPGAVLRSLRRLFSFKAAAQ